MPFYKYKVVNKEYEKEEDTLEAVSEQQVENILLGKGYQIISITPTFSWRAAGYAVYSLLGKIKTKDLVLFFRQFSVLISANINLSESLRILSEQAENRLLRQVISGISKEVDSGDRLSDAMAKHRAVFNDFHVSVIRSGESSGKLDDSLGYLADEEEKNYEIVRKVKGAMTYPLLVLITMFGVGILMMIFVIPKLVQIFNEIGGELPLMTRVLIITSNLVVKYWWAVLAVLAALALTLRLYLRQSFGKKQFDYLLLHLPIAGDLVKKISIVRFARSLSTLLLGGVTISNSLRIAKGIVGNSIYKDLINDTIIEVEKGNSISSVFITSRDMPIMVPKMMMVGEKTGKLDFVLQKIAEFYAKEVESKLDNLMVLLEPVIMIIMAVGVGFMAAAIILPMYNMTSQF